MGVGGGGQQVVTSDECNSIFTVIVPWCSAQRLSPPSHCSHAFLLRPSITGSFNLLSLPLIISNQFQLSFLFPPCISVSGISEAWEETALCGCIWRSGLSQQKVHISGKPTCAILCFVNATRKTIHLKVVNSGAFAESLHKIRRSFF